MTNLEIARLFNEEESFKEEVLRTLSEDGSVSMGYIIYTKDHEPLTEKQKEVLEKYGDVIYGDIELCVDIDLEDLLG